MNYQTVESSLTRVRKQMDGVLAPISDANWARRPQQGGWSVGEVLAHLMQVERAVCDAARKTLAKPPQPLQRKLLRVPIAVIQFRGIKRESPIPLDAALVQGKAEMLAKFAARRGETLTFLRETLAGGRDLAGYHWRHPFFGTLTFAEWCRVLAYHETRHTKQIREIVSSFQS